MYYNANYTATVNCVLRYFSYSLYTQKLIKISAGKKNLQNKKKWWKIYVQ